MNIWNTYEKRLGASGDLAGDPKRDSALTHIQSRMRRKVTASLSYQNAVIDQVNRQIAVMDVSDDLNTKKIFSMPEEDLPHGSIVKWANAIWLITEVDAHKEFCTEGRMQRCNYYLKWINDSGQIISRWCIVEDGTKYLVGKKEETIMSVGDARMALTIGKDPETSQLHRGIRFLIDDPDSTEVLAYQITKSNKLYNTYDGAGIFRFILNEVNLTDNDNVGLRIADFYSWSPKTERAVPDTKVDLPFEQIVSDAKEDRENIAKTIEESGVWL